MSVINGAKAVITSVELVVIFPAANYHRPLATDYQNSLVTEYHSTILQGFDIVGGRWAANAAFRTPKHLQLRGGGRRACNGPQISQNEWNYLLKCLKQESQQLQRDRASAFLSQEFFARVSTQFLILSID